jgi:MFS family permease
MDADARATRSTAETPAAPLAAPRPRLSRLALRMRQPSRRNYWLHVLGGGGWIMALQFGNPRLVLPWISHHLTVAYFLVALLLPLVQLGSVAAQLLITPHLTRLALRKRAVTGMGLALAGVFALIFAAAATLAPAVAAIALLGCAIMVGLSLGVLSVSHTDLQAKTVARRVRGKVAAQGATLGGILTLGTSLAIWMFLPGAADNHLLLLWLAVGAWIGFAWAHYAIQEQPSAPVAGHGGLAQVRQGLSLPAQYPWFGRYLTWRCLLLSVELAIPFYAMHAASLHDPTARNLSAFVVAIALGLVLSGPIWGRVIDRHNAAVGAAGSWLAAAAGIVVLILDQLGYMAAPFWHALLFLPLSFARQGVVQARNRHLSVKAPAQHLPAMAGFSNALLACAGIVVALIVGAAGHLHDIRTPLVILIACNVAAALYARRAFAD